MVHQEDRQVAHDFTRRRDFDDVAKGHVDVRVGARNLVPARAQAHGLGLFLQVGVLATGHFVDINFGGAGLGLRYRMAGSRCALSPSNRQHWLSASRSMPVSRSVCASAATMEFRLGWLVCAAHRSDGAVGHVDAGFGRLQNGSRINAAGVVRVQMNRDADFFAQRLDQFLGGIGTAESGHVLDGQDMRAHALQLFRHADVIIRANICRAPGRECRRV